MPPNDLVVYECKTRSENNIFIDVELKQEENFLDFHESDFETAINYAGNGKFQIVLLAVSGCIYATCAISSTTLSFVLPSAECDFSLSSRDKGTLSAIPLLGMLFGCFLWGSLANTYGRRMAILISLMIDFLAAVASSSVNSYVLFVICRFFNGFGIIGATSLIFSYLGEFLSVQHRDKYLGKLEIFWNIGVIILPGVAWCFLNKKSVQIFEDGGNFSPWRTFVLVCSVPSLISIFLLYFFPETPKFLISKGKFKEARAVFQQIYRFNRNDDHLEFPVNDLENSNNSSTKILSKQLDLSQLSGIVKGLIQQQYCKYLTITCLADFGLMASYYTLVMWFPEIFERFNEFNAKFPETPASICVVSQANSSWHSVEEKCDPAMENDVFLDTMIIGLSCIPTSVSLSYFMYKCGKKFILVSSLLLSGLCTLGLNWVSSVGQTLVLSCTFEALTSILEAVLFCVVVDLFPTNIRALALATTATCGRLGAIFGNLVFGALLDLNCLIPIYLLGLLLVACGLLCLAIPRNEEYITIL